MTEQNTMTEQIKQKVTKNKWLNKTAKQQSKTTKQIKQINEQNKMKTTFFRLSQIKTSRSKYKSQILDINGKTMWLVEKKMCHYFTQENIFTYQVIKLIKNISLHRRNDLSQM